MKVKVIANNTVLGFANCNTAVLHQFCSNWLMFEPVSDTEYSLANIKLSPPATQLVVTAPVEPEIDIHEHVSPNKELANNYLAKNRTIPSPFTTSWAVIGDSIELKRHGHYCVLVNANREQIMFNTVDCSELKFKVDTKRHHKSLKSVQIAPLDQYDEIFGVSTVDFFKDFFPDSKRRPISLKNLIAVVPTVGELELLYHCFPDQFKPGSRFWTSTVAPSEVCRLQPVVACIPDCSSEPLRGYTGFYNKKCQLLLVWTDSYYY